jgi:hypothetical protein
LRLLIYLLLTLDSPPTDRKALFGPPGRRPESEAESVRFHGRRVTKVDPEVKHGRL